ncbi:MULTISPECIES: nucleoside recognition domain-containing protein [Brevibacillus]|uniref:nucleoside recognition domain-containing protein n=1 Tax=Brevibacillus TaxID=55080 RepID=UPI000EC9B737|nr:MULTISPECIES: nucleoside recognition domain-containing protein [Brevibacillus]NRQ52195.1 spore maturation protein [Brevibacillus sp. HD1.4A]MDH6349166.1 spore maturation protein A [Brevibacillus sp. 1238]MDR5001182.1 nucleoside recognition domain-containing protein [Brevibacillus parabrevis]UED71402.1 spore maturation protein [Brevibacillus sp. HD3.3A]WDV97630.1 nucleoside recognition domain-containing protein [Brevibacillus parabrevis]
MLNVIWLALIVISIVVAAFTGRMEAINAAAFEGAKTGVTVCFGLLSVLAFWLGIMRVAEKSGLLALLSKALSPLIQLLFPDVPKGHPAMGYILSNMSANLLGLGNAATPMGLKAMEELQKLNPDKQKASPAMCTLLAINTASITIIPTTMIAIRMQYGSVNPVEIVGTTLVSSFAATIVALLIDRWYRYRHLRRHN